MFPKKVIVMFPSGSFKEFFAVSQRVAPQCSQSVKFKMRQNGGLKMNPSGTFEVYPPHRPRKTTFGINPGHFGNTARKRPGNCKTRYILNEPGMLPKCPGFMPKVVHHGRWGGYISNVPLGVISGTPFQLILNFTDQEHCGATCRETAKNSLNEPLRNIIITFFGNIQDVPIM